MRRNAPSPDLRPCTDGYAYTEDGWRLGVRHYRPEHPDPGKLPVILCHGLGLNATFWTITDNHLPSQLAARGYEVYVFDIRGSGENAQLGPVRPDQQVTSPDLPERARRAGLDGRRPGQVRRAGHSRLRQARDRARSRQLDRPQPGWNARLPLPRAGTASRADRQLRRDGEHDHPGGDPADRHAPRQPRAPALVARRQSRAGWADLWRSSGSPAWK